MPWKTKELCKNKEGIPSITEKHKKTPENKTTEHIKFVNNIDYNGKPVNILRFRKKLRSKETVQTLPFKTVKQEYGLNILWLHARISQWILLP